MKQRVNPQPEDKVLKYTKVNYIASFGNLATKKQA